MPGSQYGNSNVVEPEVNAINLITLVIYQVAIAPSFLIVNGLYLNAPPLGEGNICGNAQVKPAYALTG